MPVYVVTGKLGSGKTLASVGKIKDYLIQGRRVATNLDIRLENLVGNYARKCEIFRVPDRPESYHLESLGLGYDGEFIGEERNGALVLDECGTWFNSRDWNAKGRKELLDWVIHARKKRWDVYFIIQDLEVMDKQARLMFAEHVVYCRRSDRFTIPFLSSIWKIFTDKPLPFPKLHLGFVKYGDKDSSPVVDRWVYRGTDLYNAYDTAQIFKEDNNGVYQLLPPYYIAGRYTDRLKDFKNAIRNYKIKGLHFFSLGVLTAAFAVNALVTHLPGEPKKGLVGCNQAYKDLYGDCDSKPVLKTHKELVDKILSGETLEQAIGKTKDLKVEEVQEDVIYITGSVKHTNGFDYIFIKNDIAFYPRNSGFSVRWISDCQALLLKNGKSITVYCSDTELTDDTDYSYLKGDG